MKTTQAGTFKAKCLALLDEVAQTHESLVITKYGKPVAKLVPFDTEKESEETRLPGGFHNDPADRILAASCLHYGASLITRDRAICEWGYVHTVS